MRHTNPNKLGLHYQNTIDERPLFERSCLKLYDAPLRMSISQANSHELQQCGHNVRGIARFLMHQYKMMYK